MLASPYAPEVTVPTAARWWSESVEVWASSQEIDERSRRTYLEHVVRFPEYFDVLGFGGIHSATGVTREAVLAFKYHGIAVRRRNAGKPLAITTRQMGLGLLRSFLLFEGRKLQRNGGPVLELAADRNLWTFRRGQVRSDSGRRMDSPEEAARILAAAPSIDARALFALQLYGGLRPAEARDALVGDLELSLVGPSIVHVRKGKFSRPRPVQLPRHARNLILAATIGKAPGERVYAWSRSKHWRDLAVACQRAGTRHYGPHDLRRTYASFMFEAGAQLEAVQDQMGHEDPKTTRLYQGPVRVTKAVAQLEALLGA
jgi:integrase